MRLLKCSIVPAVLALAAACVVIPSQARAEGIARSKALIWRLGSQYNQAAVLTRGDKPEVVNASYAKAKMLAKLAGVDLPGLPAKDDIFKVLSEVSKKNGELADVIAFKYGQQHAALYKLSSVSMNYLMVCGANDTQFRQTYAKVIAKLAQDANLPEGMWQPLVNKLMGNATPKEICEAVFAMDDAVSSYLFQDKQAAMAR